MLTLIEILKALRWALADRNRLLAENLALRHQLGVLKRSVNRPKIEDSDRLLWILFRRSFKEWKDALIFVKPDTVVRWHRKGFKFYWKRKSRSKPGRPPIGMELIMLIRRMSQENVTWGAPKIAAELTLLGYSVADSTVAKYMVRSRPSDPSQEWKTFIKNHLSVTAACDFFTVPTVTFKVLYVFVVMSLDRRRIEHVNVTANPTALWTARQILAAFPDSVPRFLMRDRDSIFGWEFQRMLKLLNIEQVVSAPRSPWQNPFVERVIGSIRRECTDHVIPFGQRHLHGILNEYVEYYNESRTHLSLERNSPEARKIETEGEIAAKPFLGGLHHRYSRAA